MRMKLEFMKAPVKAFVGCLLCVVCGEIKWEGKVICENYVK